MTGQKPTPGRYAQDASGAWHLFTDKAALSFKPVAIVTVKAPPEQVSEPTKRMAATLGAPFKLGISRAPGSAARPAPDPAPEQIITIAKPGGGHVGIVVGDTGAAVEALARSARIKAAQPRRRPVVSDLEALDRRTATPGDVFRAIADEFGILPAMGAHRSTARFKPMARRNEDDEAADAYARAVQEGTGQE